MKIFDDIVKTINRSTIHVKVLSTHDIVRRQGVNVEDISFFQSFAQETSNNSVAGVDGEFATLRDSGDYSNAYFANRIEDSERLEKLRANGTILGAGEYFVDAMLPISELAFCISRNEPVKYCELEDVATIRILVDTYLNKIQLVCGQLSGLNNQGITNMLMYKKHIDDLYVRYFAARTSRTAAADAVSSVTLGGFDVPK